MSRGPGYSLPERLLGAAVLLLLAGMALQTAVGLVLSVVWPVIGLAVLGGLLVLGWHFWDSRRGGW